MITSLAWRNIWRNAPRSLIIMLSVTLGLFAGISVLGLYQGMLNSRVETVIFREVGHLQLHHPAFSQDMQASFILPERVNEAAMKNVKEIHAFSFRSVSAAMLSTASGSSGVVILGIDKEKEAAVSQLDRKMLEGKLLADEMKNPVVVGKKLAEKMKLHLKSKIVLTFSDSANNMVSAAFRVSGIYESENAPLDERILYVPRQRLNQLLTTESAAHELVMILKEWVNPDTVAAGLSAEFPDLKIEKWQDLSPETCTLTDIANQYSIIIISIIMLALAFGIINTMLMAVLERTREVGMLMALGMSKVRLFRLIVVETMFLTLSGFPVGLLLSWLSISYFHTHGIDLSAFRGELMKSYGFSQVIYPEFPYHQLSEVILIVLFTALLSGIFPALKALRLKPVDALRK